MLGGNFQARSSVLLASCWDDVSFGVFCCFCDVFLLRVDLGLVVDLSFQVRMLISVGPIPTLPQCLL